MKKRLVSLMLGAAILLSLCTLFGCSSDGGDTKGNIISQASESAITLVMWLVTNDTTTPEAIQAVQTEINKITQEKYKIRLVLKCYTEDEYYQKLEEALAYQLNNEGADSTEEETNEEETVVNDYGFTEIKYPEARPYQADIIYFADYDRYVSYISESYLANLDDILEDDAAKLTKYVPETFLEGVRHNGSTYAIPNYNIAGKYQYMLIDRELYDKYYQLTPLNEIRTVFDLEPFISRVRKYEDVLPIDAEFEELKSQLAYFWSVDPGTLEVTDEFSLVGYTYTDYSLLNRGEVLIEFQNLFENDLFTKNFRTLMEYRLDGCIGSTDDGERAAVSFVSGNAATLTEYGAVLVNSETDPEALHREIREDDSVKYYAVAVGYPTLTEEDLFGNMFGVCAQSQSVARSMKILGELNTNPELRNLLQYGVQNVNYTLTDIGQVHMLNDTYSMDLEKTGNVMIAYAYEGTDPNWYEAALAQNRDTVVDPLYQFSFYLNDITVDMDEFFMYTAYVPEEDVADWSHAHTKYYVYENGSYALAGDRYDAATEYYSWIDTYKDYVMVDADGHRGPSTDVYDPNATYYRDQFTLALIDDCFMKTVSLSADDNETKNGNWKPSKYFVFNEETFTYEVATGEFNEETTYYSWANTKDCYVTKDENGYYKLSPDTFDPTLEYYSVTMDMKLVNTIYDYSRTVWESFMACTTLDEVDALILTCKSQYKSIVNESLDKATNLNFKSKDENDPGLDSPYKVYYSWAKDNRYLP